MNIERQHIGISCASDASLAVNTARNMALSIGFSQKTCEEIALAVSELASNLVKHARGGKVMLSPLLEEGRPGIQVESHDQGPGIKNVEQALTDGYSTVGSLGFGLGTVNRLMDEFDITSEPGSGTHILCKRFLRTDPTVALPGPLEFGAATKAHPLMKVNGDAFVIKQWPHSALIGVIDGLGHGQYALRAAQAARQYVETHYDQPMSAIFLGVGRACRATRGVVMSLARFDWTPNLSHVTLTFAGIGNIEMHVIGRREPMGFIVRRGILGVHASIPVVTEHPWSPEQIMVLHSDGLSAHWRWSDFPELADASAEVTAQRLLQRLARDNDDATVMVARGRRSKHENYGRR